MREYPAHERRAVQGSFDVVNGSQLKAPPPTGIVVAAGNENNRGFGKCGNLTEPEKNLKASLRQVGVEGNEVESILFRQTPGNNF